MTLPAAVQHPADPDWTPPPPPPAPAPTQRVLRVRLGDHLHNPDPLYDLLAGSGTPVGYAADHQLWLLWRHADVRDALSNSRRWSNRDTLTPIYQPCPEAMAILGKLDVPPTTAAADNPVHARTSRALRATFPNTADRVAAEYGPAVDFRADQIVTLAAAHRFRTVDLAEHLALMPLWVICDLLGVGGDDIPRIQTWADGQIQLIWDPTTSPAEQVRLAQGLLDFWTFTQAHVAGREQLRLLGDIPDDWTGRVLAHRDGRDAILTLAEVASLAFNLLVAGHETTAGLLTHAVHAALSVPGKWRAMHNDPTIIPGHVEQVLRRRPPIDAWLRTTRTDIHLDGGVVIPAGQRVLTLIGAANRHPDGETLSFGRGPHYCVGAALARLEAVRVLEALTARLPKLRLKPGWQPRHRANVAFRALVDLPVVVA